MHERSRPEEPKAPARLAELGQRHQRIGNSPSPGSKRDIAAAPVGECPTPLPIRVRTTGFLPENDLQFELNFIHGGARLARSRSLVLNFSVALRVACCVDADAVIDWQNFAAVRERTLKAVLWRSASLLLDCGAGWEADSDPENRRPSRQFGRSTDRTHKRALYARFCIPLVLFFTVKARHRKPMAKLKKAKKAVGKGNGSVISPRKTEHGNTEEVITNYFQTSEDFNEARSRCSQYTESS